MSFDPQACARFFIEAHARREPYQNPPASIAPTSVAEAYAAQGALVALMREKRGPVAGFKIATTTKVMQRLMGIDHPCFGAIFASTIAATGTTIALSRYISLKVECEIALRLGAALPPRTDWTVERIASAISGAMPAFELIEDRHANYTETRALGLIADNCWNAGIVLGPERLFEGPESLYGLKGRCSIDGTSLVEGVSEDPIASFVEVANHCGGLGTTIEPGAVVMTGSIVATRPLEPGQRWRFALEHLGHVEATTTD